MSRGRNVGNYRLLGELGEGAMGTVFLALDTQLDREVALKSLRPELARRTDIVERFREEARLQGKLESPNIVRLYQFLRDGDEFFMVMEFVRGRTLSKVLAEKGRLAAPQAINIMAQALSGLGYAHKRNVIHRDVKPANIMIGDEDVAKVTDFGIARLLGSARMTKVGSIVGTLEYISPEAVLGKEATALSDIYSSGVVLYELLTGRLPFASDNEFALAKAQVENQPPPIRQWVPDIPRPLEDAVMKALAKDPARRFETAEAMAMALNNCLQSGAGVEARQEATIWGRLFGTDKPAAYPALHTDVLTPPPESRHASELEERRRKAITTVNRRVDELIGLGDWRLAQKEIEESIKLYPGEPALAELSARIAREERYYQESLDRARREVRGLLDRGLPQVAKESLDIYIARYPQDPELMDLLRQAEVDLSARTRHSAEINELDAEVAALQQKGQYQEAVTVIIEAVARLPNQPELTVLLGKTVQAQKEHEKSVAIRNCLQQVSTLRKSADWDKAFAAIEATLDRYPGDTTLLELRESVQTEHAALLREKEIEDILARAAELSHDNQLDAAEKLVVGAVERFPDEPVLRQRLIAIGAARKAARDRAVADAAIPQAKALQEKKDWPAAIAVIDTALREAPEEKRLTELRVEIEKARDRYRSDVQAAVDQGRKLLASGRLEDAFVALSGASERYSQEPAIQEALLDAQRRLAAERRERELDKAAAKADELLAGREFVQAEEFLLDSISRYPDDPRLTTRLSSAIQGRREQEKQRAIEQGLKHASELADQDRLEDAIRQLDGLLSRYHSDPRVDSRKLELSKRLREQRRSRSLAELRERAGNEAHAGRFDTTLSEIAAALREYPEDPEFVALQTTVQRDKRTFEIAKAGADAVSQAAELQGRGEYEKALAKVDAAIGLYPEVAADLSVLRNEIEQRRQLALRMKKAGDAEQEARRLASSGNPIAAWNMVTSALAECPEHAGLAALEPELAAAVLAFEARETERVVKAAVADRHWDSAEAAIEEFERKHGAANATRFRDDLEAARRARQSVLDQAVADAQSSIAKTDFIGAIGLIESLRLEGAELEVFSDLLKQARVGLEGQAFEKSFQELRDLVSMALDDGEIDFAMSTLVDARKKFDGFPLFVELEARVRRELGIAAAINKATRHLTAREWTQATQCLDGAAAEFGSDRRISDLSSRVRREQREHAAAVDAALADARALSESGQYQEALRSLTQAVERLPDVPALKEALSEAATRERAARLDAAEARARSLFSAGELEQAEKLLRKTLEDLPEESVLVGLLADVQNAQRRLAAIQHHADSVANHLKLGDAERADAALLGALREFPEASALLDLRIPVALSLARGHLSANRFAETRRLAEESVRKYGDDPRLTDLIRDVDEASRRKSELDRMLSEPAVLVDQGAPQAALAILDGFPDWARKHDDAVELRTRCQRLIVWQTAEVQRISSRAEQLFREGGFDESVRFIETASREKQLQKLLQPLLERATAMRDSARQVARIAAALDKDGPVAALRMIEDLGPDALRNPDLQLLRDRCWQRQAELERRAHAPVSSPGSIVESPPERGAERETRLSAWPASDRASAPSAAKSRLWLQIGAGVAVVVIVAGIWIMAGHSGTPPKPAQPTSGESTDQQLPPGKRPAVDEPVPQEPPSGPQLASGITLSMHSISETYKIGSDFPAPRTISVNSTGGPTSFSSSVDQSWLSVSPESGRAPGSLTVTFRPTGLATGTHIGTITCTAAGKSSTISVALTIRPGF
jgi:serine/threonine protein kinase